MVAGNVGTFNSAGGAMDWFNQLPKVTRGYAALCVFTAACVSWKIPIIQYFFLDWTKVYGSFQVRSVSVVTSKVRVLASYGC
jgi:hypothetical protein